MTMLVQGGFGASPLAPANAAGGAYTLNFSAADPSIYLPPIPFPGLVAPIGSGDGDPIIPLAEFNDGAVDVKVESLAPQDMALGQIVPFETKISVSGDTTPENGVITFVSGWNTLTTNGDDFGYDARVDDVGYGVIAAFIDTGDGAYTDTGTPATVDGFTWSLINDEIVGIFTISGLDDGDEVVLETWLVLDDTIQAGTGGNVQSRLIDAATGPDQSITVANSGAITLDNGDSISTGNQTVPLLKPSDFFTADVDLAIVKSDSPDPIVQGDQLTYTLTVTNALGSAVANSVAVTDTLDPNTTFVSATSAGATCSEAAGVVTCDIGPMAPGDTVDITIVVDVSATAPTAGTVQSGLCAVGDSGVDLCNVASVSTISDDTNPANDTATEPTDVLPANVAPDITVDKTANPTTVDEPGGLVTFTVVVTNNAAAGVGDATLDSLVDDIHGDLNGQGDCSVPQPLAGGGGTYTCSFTATVSGNAGDSETDIVTAVASNGGGSDTASDDAIVTIVDVPSAIEVVKTATPDNLDEPGGSVTYDFVVNNLSAVDDVTIDTLDDSIYGDLNGQGDCSVPQTIAAGGSYSCSITVNVSGMAGDTITNVVTASGIDDDGNAVTDDDDAVVTINDVPSAIEVVKTATPDNVDEPGGSVTYDFVVNNTSAVDSVTIDSLTDSIYGDLNGQGDCSVPQTIAAGGSYSCSITVDVSGMAGDVINNVLTVTGTDDDGNPVGGTDDADVTINDVPSSIEVIKTANPTSVDEPGDDVTFTFTVNNTSATDSVTIDSLIDSIYGDLSGLGDCSVPQTIAAGGSYSCSITQFVAGDPGDVITNVLTVAGTDDDGNPAGGTDDADVTITDVPSSIEVIKTANPTSVAEPGGDVTYTFTVNNTSAVDAVTISSLTDSIYGDLNGQGDCSVPQTIAAGGSYSCSITKTVSGNADDVITNVLTVAGTDDDGNPVGGTDDATVTITDVPSSIEVIKTANPTSVAEPGGDVTYTFTVNNTSAVDAVTISSLTDSIYGDLNGQGDCSVPQTIAAGGSYSCSITKTVSGNADDVITNVLTVAGTDDDGNPVGGTDDATVTITDVPSSILLTKTVTPEVVDEPGGAVTYSIVVQNTSLVDTVTINTISDPTLGDITAFCDDLPAVLLPGETVSCTVPDFVSGNAGDVVSNTATANGVDDDGDPVSDDDDATVTIDDVPSSILTTKTANPTSVPETGGDVTFTITVENTSAVDTVTINSVVDTVFGDVSASCVPALPANLAPGESVTCAFTEFLSGDAGEIHTNVATASGEDDDGNPVEDEDDEDVPFEDVLPDISIVKSADPTSVPETGGDVTFTFLVTNNSLEDATLDSLVDSDFGDLNGQGDCSVPQPLAGSGGTYTCSITVFLSGDASGPAHNNVVTATASDDDGNTDEATDDETVPFEDVLPDISIVKTADPTSVPETGADVEFTIVVTNNSLEDATIESLVDSDFDLAANCADAAGTVLASGATYTCVFTEFISGDFSGPAHENTATVVASDNDGNTDTESDDETVVFEDVLPDITVEKTADPTTVPETGGNVLFTFQVTNNSAEDASLTGMVDTVYGDLDGQGDCVFPQALAANGGSFTCSFVAFVSGDASGPAHNNVVTATAEDDDGNVATDDDDATVTFDDVLPDVSITKTADPTSVPETGADVEFTIVVTNNSLEDATIDSLVDSDFDLAVHCADAVGTVLASGATYTCVFTEFISGDFSGPAHENTATVVASDNDGNTDTESDDETVTFDDVLPDVSITKTADPTSVPETGADVEFTIVVTNNSLEDATIDSLVDSDFDLGANCADAVGTVLASGATYTCVFTESISGDFSGPDHENTATVVASDNDGNSDTESDDETVVFTDVLPDVSITKTADPTSVDEPGATVTFTLVVTNNSLEEVDIDSLTDSDYNDDLAASCPEATDINLQFNQSYTCVFTAFVAGNAADGDHVNTATVVVSDNDGNTASDDDDETVVIADVAPVIDVFKTPNQDQVFAPGEDVLFTIRVENNSVSTDPVTITSLVDDVFGDVSAECILPQTIGAGGAFECDITRTIAADHTNTVTATAVDDEGTEVTDSASASVDVINPAISIEKNTGPADADLPPGPEILVGGTVNWFYQVTNVGDVPLSNLVVTDDQGVVVNCATDTLPAGASTVCEGTGTSVAGQYANIGTATATHTDVDGDTATRSDDDPSHYFGAAPSVDIVKTFTDDSVIAGGAGSSFTLVVTNDGNVDLDDVSVFDDVDDRLTVTGVSGTAGADADSDIDAQTVEWLISSLGAGDSVTITVDFTVASNVEEANGAGGLNDAPAVSNTGVVSDTYNDDVDNSTDIGDEDSDTIDILVDINLSIVKTFDPTSVPQGTAQSFTIEVSNAGPSDAVDVSVTDSVNTSLEVTGVSTSSGDCSATVGQELDCTVQIPAGQSVTITVDYLVAPFLDEDPLFGGAGGDEFRFVFVNGSILEGSTATGEVYLDGVDVSDNATFVSSVTRNDIFIDPDGDGPDPAFEMHLSCSDPFTGGWGQSAGPVEGVDVNWQIAFFSIARYNNNGFIKNCGNVVNPFDVPNTATATGEDSFGTETVSDDATVTITPGITIDKLQTNGKRLTVRLTNFTGEDKVIEDISIEWPDSNGNLTKIRLDDVTTWTGAEAPPDALLDATDSGWSGGTLMTGEAILRFDFKNKVDKDGPYVIRVNFTDGTFLDINI